MLMLSEMIMYHKYIVDSLLLVMVINLILPYVLRNDINRMVFWVRVGYFFYWAIWSMTIFAGLILFMFTSRELTIAVWTMIVASTILGILDAYRGIKTKQFWIRGNDGVWFSSKIILAEISTLAIVVVVTINT